MRLEGGGRLPFNPDALLWRRQNSEAGNRPVLSGKDGAGRPREPGLVRASASVWTVSPVLPHGGSCTRERAPELCVVRCPAGENSTGGAHQNCRPSCGCRLQRYTVRRLRSLFFILLSGTPADKCGAGGPSGRRRSPRRYETSRSLRLGPVFGRKHTRTATLARLLETETEAEEAGAVTADRAERGRAPASARREAAARHPAPTLRSLGRNTEHACQARLITHRWQLAEKAER